MATPTAPAGRPTAEAQAAGRIWSGRRPQLALLGILFFWGVAQPLFVYALSPSLVTVADADIVYGFGTAAIILFLARSERSSWRPPSPWPPSPCPPSPWPPWASPALILGAFFVAALLAQFALEAFPSSGDEYGYVYLADTLLHGRLWNPGRPAALHDVFQTMYIADRDGRRLSQYPPGWPAVLAGFLALRAPQFANPVLGLLAAGFLWRALRQVPVAPATRFAALLLGAASPFAVFNAASFYNHTLTAACLLAIVWLDLRDEARGSFWNRAGIGFAFSVLLTTRYEDFAIAAVLFVLDGLIRRRWRFFSWAWPAATAAAPVAALLLLYDWRITGNPFQTTLAWASPEIGFGLHASGVEGSHSALRGVSHTVWWTLDWQNFAPVMILPLYGLALYRRAMARTLRWFDLLLPTLAAFFVFYPDGGGFQFGPRYWFFGYVALPVTVAAGLASPDGLWTFRRLRLDPLRLAMAQMACFVGFTAGLALFCHMRVGVRMLPLRVAATAPAPAIVLVASGVQRYSWFQRNPDWLLSVDMTRNGLQKNLPPVAIGNDLGAARTGQLCRQFPDRHVFRLVLAGAPPAGRLQAACERLPGQEP